MSHPTSWALGRELGFAWNPVYLELRGGTGNLHAMAAVACQMITLRVVQRHRVTLDSQAVRGCRAVTRCAALGARCAAVSTVGARLRATGADKWGCRSSSGVRFVASAVAEEAVSASQADSGAPAESLSMYFKVLSLKLHVL